MKSQAERPVKFATYLTPRVVKALRRFSVDQGYCIYQVVEAALKKCLPQKYYY